MSHLQLSIILFACVIFINACGQTGDLYMPEEEPQTQSEPAAENSAATEASEEEPEEE